MRPLAERFDAAGKGIYLVGGIVRDLLVNRTLGPRADVDLPTDARPAETNRSSATGPRVVEPGERFGTIGAKKGERRFEITSRGRQQRRRGALRQPNYITGRTRRPARALPRRGTGWAGSS